MSNRFVRSVFGLIALAFSTVMLAQRTAQQPEPEAKPAPRAADGKPDLSGTWVGGARPTGGELAPQYANKGTLELTKWGQEKFEWNRGPESANAPGVYRGQVVRVDQDPVYHCYPPGLVRLGPPAYIISGGSGAAPAQIEILQTPGKIIMIFQYRNSVRHIYTDG